MNTEDDLRTPMSVKSIIALSFHYNYSIPKVDIINRGILRRVTGEIELIEYSPINAWIGMESLK